MKKSLLVYIITFALLVASIVTSTIAFASAPSHSSHSSAHVVSHTTLRYHCGVIGRQIGTGKPVGCVKPTTFTPVAWTGNTQHIIVPATWVLHYSCDGGMLNLYVFDVTGKVTGHPYETLEHRFETCDNAWHSETFTMSTTTTIAIQTGRTDGFAITISA